VFGSIASLPPYWPKPPATREEAALSDAMVGYWTSFARSGAPTAAGQPPWPAFGTAGAYMAFEDGPRPSADPMPRMYALHEEVVCRRRAEGNAPWNWNIGLWSPPLPPEATGCR